MTCPSPSAGDSVPFLPTEHTTLDLLRTGQHPHSLMPLGRTHIYSSLETSLRSPSQVSLLQREHSHLCSLGKGMPFILSRYTSATCWALLQLRLWDTTTGQKQKRKGGLGGGARGKATERKREEGEGGKDWEGHLRCGSHFYLEKRCNRGLGQHLTHTLLPTTNIPSQSPLAAP